MIIIIVTLHLQLSLSSLHTFAMTNIVIRNDQYYHKEINAIIITSFTTIVVRTCRNLLYLRDHLHGDKQVGTSGLSLHRSVPVTTEIKK